TLDHVSNGRAILGIGAAWNESEARDFGFDFGSGVPERLRWLGEALPIMRGMLEGQEPAATGPRYRALKTRNLPPPIQKHLPILIGGSGEKVTLRLVARFADMNNIGGTVEEVRRREAILLEHCGLVGRDPSQIERTLSIGTVFIRDEVEDAKRFGQTVFERNRMPPWKPIYGTPEQIADRLVPFARLGYRHLIANFPAPYDNESITRFATEVRPLLEHA